MTMMREKWTDERMDDLSARMSEGFNRSDADLREIRTEIGGLREEMNARFDSMQRTIVQVGGGMIATLAAGFAGVLLTQI